MPMPNLAATLGATYYFVCAGWIYATVTPWTLRPQSPASAEKSGGAIGGNDPPPPSKSDKGTPLLGEAERKEHEDAAAARGGDVNRPRPVPRLSIFVRLGPSRAGPEANPFYSDSWHLAGGARLKMSALGPILVPFRFVGAAAAAVAAALLSTVAVAGLPRRDFECGTTRPLSWWRRALRHPVRLLLRALLFCMGYLWIEEDGRPAVLSEAPIVVSNHLGLIEPLILAVRTGGMPVSRIENASLPLFGAVAKIFLPIFVDRTDANSRQAVKDEIESRARGAVDGTYRSPVFLFPEGTTTNGTSVITFKAGAFNPRLPVQPVVFRFPHAPGHFYPSWTVVSPSLPELLIRMLCEPWNRCKITWLPRVQPVEEEMSEWPGPKLFAARVQGIVADALGSKSTQFAFEDVRLMHEARKLGDKYSALATGGAVVEFKHLQEELVDMDLDDAKRYLEKFSELDKTCDGELTFEEFRAAFGDRMSLDALQRIFDILDDDCSGRLNFREFLVGASLVNASSDKTMEEALKFSFKIFDTKNQGKMDFDDAQRILRVIYPDIGEESLRNTFNDMDKNGNGLLDQDEFVSWVKRNEEMLPNMKKLLFG